MRREGGFEVTDRIHVKIEATERVRQCFEKFGTMISGEILAVSVDFGHCEGTVWDLNGEPATIALIKQ